jgi:polyhydroxyalkanoate synthesis regulator protein
MGKQNMALFQQALKMLSPYGREAKAPPADQPAPAAKSPEATEAEDPRLRRLEAQIEALRHQLEALGRNREDG